MEEEKFLIYSLLKTFIWIDDALQDYLKSRHWPQVTRRQSMIMTLLGASGDNLRPSNIAERLGMSPQATHRILREMEDKDLVEFVPDPADRRAKIVKRKQLGIGIDKDARFALRRIEAILQSRIGRRAYRNVIAALEIDAGERPSIPDIKSRR